jgi:hypothetical protein
MHTITNGMAPILVRPASNECTHVQIRPRLPGADAASASCRRVAEVMVAVTADRIGSRSSRQRTFLAAGVPPRQRDYWPFSDAESSPPVAELLCILFILSSCHPVQSSLFLFRRSRSRTCVRGGKRRLTGMKRETSAYARSPRGSRGTRGAESPVQQSPHILLNLTVVAATMSQLWGGLFLRDTRLRSLLPLRRLSHQDA